MVAGCRHDIRLRLVEDNFDLYLALLIMIGSGSIVPDVGVGIALFRRVGRRVIIPFWMLSIIVPAIVAVIGSAAVGIVLLIGLLLTIMAVVRWIRSRSD